eukprot:1008361-Rhodomonas_salina.1
MELNNRISSYLQRVVRNLIRSCKELTTTGTRETAVLYCCVEQRFLKEPKYTCTMYLGYPGTRVWKKTRVPAQYPGIQYPGTRVLIPICIAAADHQLRKFLPE